MPRFMWAALAISLALGPVAAGASAQETTLRLGEAGTAELDPHRANILSDSILLYNVYETLIFPEHVDGRMQMRPALAESIKANDDYTIFNIHLREGVRFHSGNVLTAGDVAFSMDRMLALRAGASFFFDGWVAATEVVDPRTVRFRLTRPYPAFVAALSRLAIVDAGKVKENIQAGPYGELGDYGAAWLGANGAGAGAYEVVSHNRTERTELRRFPAYFRGVARQAPDRVRIAYNLRDQTVIAMFRRRELDVASNFFSSETKRQLLTEPGVSIASEAGAGVFVLKPNNTRPPFDDVHCRRALAFALDYESMMSVEQVTADVRGAAFARAPMPSDLAGFDPAMPEIRQDMDRAREELARCRYRPQDVRIGIVWITAVPRMQRMALIAQQSWQALGFRSDIEPRVFAQWAQQVTNPETTPAVGQLYALARIPDADAFLYNTFHSSRRGQTSAAEHFSDPEVDRLLDQARTEISPAGRAALYGQALRRLEDLKATFASFEIVNTYPVRNSVEWPSLQDPSFNTGLMGGNHLFRLARMTGKP